MSIASNRRVKRATKSLRFDDPKQLANLLFADSAAGIQISGDSGSGKSNAGEVLVRSVIRQGYCVFGFDPHGSLAESLRDFVLAEPNSIRRRLTWIEPGNTKQVTSINPLAVHAEGADEFTWKSKLINKCGHTSRILLSAFGEEDFDGKPRLQKWVTRLLVTLASAGLSLADAQLFLNVGSPVYRSLVQAVPDLMARHEFDELSTMRATDRENIIESTKNRVLGLLANPIIESTFGRSESAIDVASLYERNAIVLLNLASQGVLREEDQSILANLWLSEILHTVFNTPANRRRPIFVCIDELPVFKACAPLLSFALTQVRKFQLRFILMHQGTINFPDGTNDRLLNNLVSQCRVHVYMRHANPVDAKFFGEVVALPTTDPLKIKHQLKQKQQYQDGHRLVTLVDRSNTSNDSETTGSSQSDAQASTDNWNEGQSDERTTSDGRSETRDADGHRLSEAVSRARSAAQGRSSGRGGSTGSTQTSGTNWGRTIGRSVGVTYKQSLVPILKWREIIASVTFFTPDEQLIKAASGISRLLTGEAIVQITGVGVAQVMFPLIHNPYAKTPKFLARKIVELWRELARRPEYATPAAIAAERSAVIDRLVAELDALVFAGQGALPAPRTNTGRRPGGGLLLPNPQETILEVPTTKAKSKDSPLGI